MIPSSFERLSYIHAAARTRHVIAHSVSNQGTSEPGGVGASHVDEFVAIREATMNDFDAIAEMLREREDEATGSRLSDEIHRRISLIEDTLRRETMRRSFVAVLADGRIVGMGRPAG